MIIKENDKTIVLFGGDILVANTIPKNKKVYVIMGGLPDSGNIGEYCLEYVGKSSEVLINPIELHFSNPLSIDVVIETLQKAKEELLTL